MRNGKMVTLFLQAHPPFANNRLKTSYPLVNTFRLLLHICREICYHQRISLCSPFCSSPCSLSAFVYVSIFLALCLSYSVSLTHTPGSLSQPHSLFSGFYYVQLSRSLARPLWLASSPRHCFLSSSSSFLSLLFPRSLHCIVLSYTHTHLSCCGSVVAASWMQLRCDEPGASSNPPATSDRGAVREREQ